MKLRPQLPTYHHALNVSGKLKRMSPTCVWLPYDGLPADVGEPDLKAGRGCSR